MKYLFNIILVFCFVAHAQNKFPKNSLFNIQIEWLNIENKKVKLEDYKGQKLLITMVYTRCPHSCPLTIEKVKEIESATKNKNFKILLISFDPLRDTPSSNRKYLNGKKLDPKRWILLSAQKETDVRELAVALGINYQDMGDGDFSHSNIITVLSPEGAPLEKLEGFQASVDKVIKSLSEN